jgi:hypothetical protein
MSDDVALCRERGITCTARRPVTGEYAHCGGAIQRCLRHEALGQGDEFASLALILRLRDNEDSLAPMARRTGSRQAASILIISPLPASSIMGCIGNQCSSSDGMPPAPRTHWLAFSFSIASRLSESVSAQSGGAQSAHTRERSLREWQQTFLPQLGASPL